MMAAAINQDDDLSSEEIRPEIAALLATVERLKADNATKAAQIAELRRRANDGQNDDQLRPLKQLCQDSAEYEAGLRGARTKALKATRIGGRLYSKPAWMARWRRITGRPGCIISTR
jgi:hypothetical protein